MILDSSDNNKVYWAGCNYYINRGNNEFEPIGTATSMHDCISCERINYCKVKQETDIWIFNADIEKELTEKWNSMFGDE